MTIEQPRTNAASRDRSPAHQYTLSIEETVELYANAGCPRTPRAIQKYCALSKLDCHEVETETGEKYLVALYSVYINEVSTFANSRDHSRTDANIRSLEGKDKPTFTTAANSPEQSRTFAPLTTATFGASKARTNSCVIRYVKDSQIKELTERARETNLLITGLQKMLTPLLGRRDEADTEGS